MKCRRPGSLRDADNLRIHQGKTEVSEASTSITVDENVQLQLTYEPSIYFFEKAQTYPCQVTMNDIVGMNYQGRVTYDCQSLLRPTYGVASQPQYL
jgi:hypothetical protein